MSKIWQKVLENSIYFLAAVVSAGVIAAAIIGFFKLLIWLVSI